MNLSYVGQNQDSRLYAKKSRVIFLKPKLLDLKHGAVWSHDEKNKWPGLIIET